MDVKYGFIADTNLIKERSGVIGRENKVLDCRCHFSTTR